MDVEFGLFARGGFLLGRAGRCGVNWFSFQLGGGLGDGLAEAAWVDDQAIAGRFAGVDERRVCFGGGEAKGGEFGEGVFWGFFEWGDGGWGERCLRGGDGGGLLGEGGDDGLRLIHCDGSRGKIGRDAVFDGRFWQSGFVLGRGGGNRCGLLLVL